MGPTFTACTVGCLPSREWHSLWIEGTSEYADYKLCVCRNCRGESLWHKRDGRRVDPVIGGGPRPHIEMTEDVRTDYEEARRIVGQSPRGACALLRLAVQKLCKDLGEEGENINADIKSLVQKGLPEKSKRRWTPCG